MARFNLKDGNAIRALGAIIRGMGARIAAYGVEGDGQNERQSASEAQFAAQITDEIVFDDSLKEAREQMSRAADATKSLDKNATFVQFHFDQTIIEKGRDPYRIVNVVVNDFSNKLVRGPDNELVLAPDDQPSTELGGVAEESLGFIVFARCG